MWDPATLACSLALPPSNPHKTEPAAMLSLDWAAVCDGAPPGFSHQVRAACSDPFFACQGHYPHYIHHQLCKVYEPKCMDVKNVQKWVIEFMYRCTDVNDEQRSSWPLDSTETFVKVEQEMLEDHTWVECISRPTTSWKTRSSTTCTMWWESSMTRVY